MLLAMLLTTALAQDIRGPVTPLGKPPRVGRQSVQAAEVPAAIQPNDRGPGIGKWIWKPGASASSVVRFRKTLTIDGSLKLARAWITADVRYRLWVNGQLASRGPADVGRDYDTGACGPWFEDARDLTRFFHEGENLVAVEVFGHPVVSSEGTTGKPGLKVDFKFGDANGEIQTAGTEASWSCAEASDLDQSNAKNGFRIDLTQEPAGWQTIAFTEAGWSASQVMHRDQAKTLVSELPEPLEAILPATGFTRVSSGVKPNLKTAGAHFENDGTYTVQYGHILSGYVGLRVNGHLGTRLLITPNEHDAPGANRSADIVLRDGEQVVDLPYMDSFSVINIKAVGVSKALDIGDVRCVFTSFPVRYLGEFSCSRPDFNRMWEVCRWVTQICMQTHHLDSPHHQEPISDAGDYLIESLNSLYAFGEGTLARQDLKKIARTLEQRKYQSFHTSYSLLWLRMLMQYYEFTGDSAPVTELAPHVFALLDRFEGYIGSTGLISEAPNYMFMDWVEIEGFGAHHPPAVIGQGYMTALYYQALGDAIKVAEQVHDSTRVARFQDLRSRIKKAFDTELWSPEKGLYRDGKAFQTKIAPNQWLPADKQMETFSTQGNTLAVSCGLASPDRAREVMKSVLGRADMNCQPYFMHFVFEAMAIAGLFEKEAVRQIERWQIVPDTQSFHEMWTVGDLSHAWNATPMFQMSGRILGVQPTAPGFAKFRIAPQPCGLKWAKGKVPTPHGPISVSWEALESGLKLKFNVPSGTQAEINGRPFGPGRHTVDIKEAK